MEKVIETSRFVLKLLEKSDEEFYFNLYQNPFLMSKVGCFSDSNSLLKSFNHTVKLNSLKPIQRITYCIFDDAARIGITSLIRSDIKRDECEIGTIICSERLNNGVASEIMKELINMAFRCLVTKRICAHFSSVNVAALRLVNRLGFTVEPEIDGFRYCYIENIVE